MAGMARSRLDVSILLSLSIVAMACGATHEEAGDYTLGTAGGAGAGGGKAGASGSTGGGAGAAKAGAGGGAGALSGVGGAGVGGSGSTGGLGGFSGSGTAGAAGAVATGGNSGSNAGAAGTSAGAAGSAAAGAAGSAGASAVCSKHLTVVFSVGTGASATASLSNGCWTVVDADGSANKSFRKCSTSNFTVKNADAPNYAYDDTNPLRPLSQDESYLAECAKGATGDGYEFLAHRGGWRLLHADHLRAYFAELYGDATNDVASLEGVAGVYPDAPEFKAHAGHVFPMINIGPDPAAGLDEKIGAVTKKLCATIPDGGYFGTYVATWDKPMKADDARVKALAHALNVCTQ